jgi:hypothetical protein
MIGRVWLVGVALTLAATPLGGQGYRVSLDTRAQTVAFRGVVLDSIPIADTVRGPSGGLFSPDGIAVYCLGSDQYCRLFRPGPAVHAAPLTLTADVALWGFGVAGLSARATMRASGDLAAANAWPGNDPGVQLYTGYLEYAAARLTARGGRLITTSRLGTESFDGFAVTVRDLVPGLELDAFGGWGLELGTSLPVTSPALNPLDDFQPQERQLMAGVGAGWSGALGSARVNYEREVDPRSDYFVSERVGFQATMRPVARFDLQAGADYDVAAGVWGSAEATLTYAEPVWAAAASVRRYRPHFELWTIWGAFSPVPYHAVSGHARLRVGSRVWLRGRAEWYAYESSDASTPLVTNETDGWRWEAGGTVRPGADWTIDAGLHSEFGPGSSSQGLEAAISWAPADRPYGLTLHGATLLRPLEFRYSESDLLVLGLAGQAEPSDRVRMSVGVTHYAETRDRPDAAAFDFDQLRFEARVILSFGADEGLGSLPPAVRRMPGGRAARSGEP